MISLFKRKPLRDAAGEAYGRVVAQARRTEFFEWCEVPDTVDGRFELICLHAFLYLRRIKREPPPAAELGQLFFDAMFTDFDRSLREMGTGDLSVGRHIKHMAQGFYGRIQAYDAGLASDDAELRAALLRNLYGTAPPAEAALATMAAYLRREDARLHDAEATELLAGRVHFGPPPGQKDRSSAPEQRVAP